MVSLIGPLHDPVTLYGINYTGTQITQWDFQNKGTRTSPARLSFVLKVPLRNLRPSVVYSVPCDRIVQRAYFALGGVFGTCFSCSITHQHGFYFLKSVDMKSTGIGKMIVEFFSAEMVFRVCR